MTTSALLGLVVNADHLWVWVVLGISAVAFICSPDLPYVGRRAKSRTRLAKRRRTAAPPPGAGAPASEQVTWFYGDPWKDVGRFVPDESHSHIGGITATQRYVKLLALAPNKTLLDVGCGFGGTLFLAARATGCRGVGVDLIKRRITVAQRRSAMYGLHHQLYFHCHDFLSWQPPTPQTYDAVTVLDVLVHVDDKIALIEKLAGLIRPAGRLLLVDYFADYPLTGSSNHLFCTPGLHAPCTSRDLLERLPTFGLEVVISEDLTDAAIRETRRLLLAIEDSRASVRAVEQSKVATTALQEWLDMFASGRLSYQLYLAASTRRS